MKLMIPTLAAVAIATGGYAIHDNTTPDVQKKQQVEQKQQADPTKKKQLTEEQQRAHAQKKAAKLAKMTDEERKAYEQNMAAKKAQMTDEQKRALKQKQGLKDPQKKQMTEEQRAAQAKKKAANAPAGKQKLFRLVTQQDVERAWQSAPVNAEMVISYREIAGLEGRYQWHIGDTAWWVRLHGATGQEMAQLDETKTYRVTGFVLDQNYGVIEVWLKSLASN
jgi:hypothetical protein